MLLERLVVLLLLLILDVQQIEFCLGNLNLPASLFLDQILRRGCLYALKLKADDLVYKAVQFRGAITGRARTFSGVLGVVTAQIPRITLGDYGAVLFPVPLSAGRQSQPPPTVAAEDVSHQKGLPPCGKGDVPLFLWLCPLLEHRLCPLKQFYINNLQLGQHFFRFTLPVAEDTDIERIFEDAVDTGRGDFPPLRLW